VFFFFLQKFELSSSDNLYYLKIHNTWFQNIYKPRYTVAVYTKVVWYWHLVPKKPEKQVQVPAL